MNNRKNFAGMLVLLVLLVLPATLLLAQGRDIDNARPDALSVQPVSPTDTLTIEWVGSIGGTTTAVAVDGNYAYIW